MPRNHTWNEEQPVPLQECTACGQRRIPLGRAVTSKLLLAAEESICPISAPAPNDDSPARESACARADQHGRHLWSHAGEGETWFWCDGNSTTTRPTWDDTWMNVADTMALRSLCEGRQVGAVIVDRNNRPVSTGYNGPPQGFPTRGESCGRWCQRQKDRQSGATGLSYGLSCPTVHAEANALMFADRRDYEGGTIYVSAACCQDCIKMVANSGVARLVMRLSAVDMHRNPHDSIEFARTCGLDVRTVE